MPDWLASRFSLIGLLVVVIQQVPGIIWALHPPEDDPFSRNSGTLLFEMLEKGFGIASLLMLIVVPVSVGLIGDLSPILVVGSFVILAAYYGFYVAYYLGITRWVVLLGMALFPPMAYLLAALYQGNVLAVLTTAIFGATHVALTYRNLGPAHQRHSRHTN